MSVVASTWIDVLRELGWTVRTVAGEGPVDHRVPGLELGAVLAFLAVYAVGFLGFGMGAVHSAFPPGQAHELLVMAVKLGVHVVLPVLLLLALGARDAIGMDGGPSVALALDGKPLVGGETAVPVAVAIVGS